MATSLLVTTACGGASEGSADRRSTSGAAAVTDDAPAEGSDPAMSAGTSSAGQEPTPGPEESFRAWLVASRIPDAAVACEYMTPKLVDKMIAEIGASGLGEVSDCAQLIESTAALYKAAGSDAEVTVDLRSQSTRRAELWVEYVASGNCGTVDMRLAGGRWTMTDLSEEHC